MDEGYRRGTVLGFTVAEVFILLVFLILLALASVSQYWTGLLAPWRDVIVAARERDLTAEEVGELLDPERVEPAEEHQPTPEELRKEIEELAREKERLQERVRALENSEEAKDREIEKLEEEKRALDDQIRIFGKGINPPCWYQVAEENNPNTEANFYEKPYYLLDIAVFGDYMEVQPILPYPPGRAEDDSGALYVDEARKIPLTDIPYNERFSNSQFRNAMQPIWRIGEASEIRTYSCIFYVRVWDETDEQAKDRWKLALRIVQEGFGTHEVENVPWDDRESEPVNVPIHR